jgi:hypothetical protein
LAVAALEPVSLLSQVVAHAPAVQAVYLKSATVVEAFSTSESKDLVNKKTTKLTSSNFNQRTILKPSTFVF